MRNLCALLVAVASLAWITGIDGQSIETEFTGSGGLFIASCIAWVPEPGRTVTINFEGTGGIVSPTRESPTGTFSTVRTFFSRAASDSGMYRCTLTIDGVITDTTEFVIDFPDAVVFNISLSQPSGPATVGMDYEITCRANFKTPVNGMVIFEWRGPDNNPVSTSDGFAILTTLNEFSMLQLNPVQESQAGAYTCLATSSSGITLSETSDEVVVNAGVAINLSLSQPPGPAIAGADYIITCEAAVNGTATYQWRGPDNNPVSLSDGFAILTQGGTSMLLFDPARESQAGVYTCLATFNGITVNKTSAEVVVNVPEITLDIVSTNQPVLGQNYSFICEVTIAFDISPTTTYFLTRNGQSSSRNQPFVLSFEPLTLADAGMYLCSVVISSPYINDDINVEMEQVLNFTIPTPTVRLNITPALPLPQQSSPRLTCRVDFMEVNIAATITVTINGPNRLNTGTLTFPIIDIENVPRSVSNVTTDLDLQNIALGDGDGMYTCTAHIVANEFQQHIFNSGIGMNSIDIVVMQEARNSPRVPEEINAVSTQNTVTISWSFIIMLSFKNEVFTVKYGTTPGNLNLTSDEVPGTSSNQNYSVTLVSLQPGTTYYYQIQSTNSFDSLTSEELSINTMDARSTPVRNVMSETPDETTLVLTWLPPQPTNGQLSGYTVRISGGNTMIVQDIAGTEMNFSASNLSAGVPYNVSIIPVNLAGQGNFSTTTYFTQELTPNVAVMDVVVERTFPTTVDVSWRPLTLSEARGFVTFYSIAYTPTPNSRRRQAPQDTMYVNASADSSSVTIQGLDGDLAYSVTVAGGTRAGTGPESGNVVVDLVALATTTSETPDLASDNTAIIVGGIVGGVVAVIFILAITAIIITVIVVLAVVVRGRQNKTPQEKDSTPAKECVDSEQLHIYNTIDGPKYEVVRRTKDVKGVKEEQFVLNECPAYLPTGGRKGTDSYYETVAQL